MTDQTRDLHEPADASTAWRWLAVMLRPPVGWALAVVGFAAILVGYLGVSREALVAKQLPYLISGGIGGLALVILGGLILGIDDLRRTTRRLDDVERQVADLHRLLLTAEEELATASGGPHPPADRVDRNDGTSVVALAEGQSFHRPDCSVVRGKRVRKLAPERAAADGLMPCRLCDPARSTT